MNRLYARDAAVGGNVARFINHSCRPNCYVQVVGETIWIRAAKNIRRGEELTYDYNTEGAGSIPCRCRPGVQGHPVMRALYLHGFASSAHSSKAAFFRSKLSAHGVEMQTPDFNAPDFSTLTVSRMLAQVHDAIEAGAPGPVALIGSSLGAFVAVHAALQDAGASIAWSCWRRRSTSAAIACAISGIAASTSGAAPIVSRCSTTVSGG